MGNHGPGGKKRALQDRDVEWFRTTAVRAVQPLTSRSVRARLLSAGRSSQAWRVIGDPDEWVVRIPIPQSGRSISYRSEQLIGELLTAAGHPVSTWQLAVVDDVECSVGTMCPGRAIARDEDWSAAFVVGFAALLADLHGLETTGWGPLENRRDRLQGISATANDGILARWFHASIWPFDATPLEDQPLSLLEPELARVLAPLRDEILEAASGPFGLVHSDLHREHLLTRNNELTGLLDFGDAFIGSTAWDFALLNWYYGATNAHRVAKAYGTGDELEQRAALLAIAVGAYKVAKTPGNPELRTRLRELLVETR